MKTNGFENSNEGSRMSKRGFEISNGTLLTDELIQMRSNAMFNKRYRFLSRNSGNIHYGYFECLEHHVVFEQHLSSHFGGRVPKNCTECYHRTLKLTNNVKNFSRKREKHPHSLSDEFVKNKCREVFKGKLEFIERDPENYRYGIYECAHGIRLRNMVTYMLKGSFPKGCNTCSRENRKYEIKLTPEIIRERSYEQFQGKIYYLERSDKDPEKGWFICREHGIKFTQKLYKHFKGQKSCILCQKDDSRLSTLIFQELQKYCNKEDILKEKTFDDCKNLYHLKYDYYIEKLNLLIECDGEGHFFAIPQWGGEDGLKTRISNDKIKDEYTKKKSFNFLRISFFEINNIANILKEYFERIEKGEVVYRIHNNKLPNQED